MNESLLAIHVWFRDLVSGIIMSTSYKAKKLRTSEVGSNGSDGQNGHDNQSGRGNQQSATDLLLVLVFTAASRSIKLR